MTVTIAKIWALAGTQIFYSLGPAWGGMLTMASYSKFDYNFMRAALYLPVMCALTSLYAGFAVFGVIGHVLYRSGEDNFDAFVKQGPGLTFVAYPEALAALPGAPIWSVLFFLMIFSIGLDTQFVSVEVVTSALFDQFTQIKGKWRVLTIAGLCVFEMIIGMLFATRAGFYIYQIIDWYGSGFTVVTIAFAEFIAFSYVVGPKRILSYVQEMIGPLRTGTKIFWIVLMCVSGPILSGIVIVSSFTDVKPPKTYDNVSFPDWAIYMGWGVAAFSLIELPIVAVYVIWQYRKNWRGLFKPNSFYLEHAQQRKLTHERLKAQLQLE